MGCNCSPVIITPTPKCSDCLVAKTIRYGCNDAPDPCGETVEYDLSEINYITACTGQAVYSIKKYDEDAFEDVSITEEGVLTFTTANDVFVKNKEYEITYKISCSNSNLSTTAKVYVCMNDKCKTKPKGSACNQCTGEYILAKDHRVKAAVSTLNACAGSGTIYLDDIIEFTGSGAISYLLISKTLGLTNVLINASTGELSFDKSGNTKDTQSIVYGIQRGSLYSEGIVYIEIKDLCKDVHCSTGNYCDECTGDCENASADIEII
jgi:uncharacterized protein with PIN domain